MLDSYWFSSKSPFADKWDPYTRLFDEPLRQTPPVLIVPQALMVLEVSKKFGFSGGICLPLTIIYGKRRTTRIRRLLCKILFITEMSARSGFSCHICISDCVLQKNVLYLPGHSDFFLVSMFFDSKDLLLVLTFVSMLLLLQIMVAAIRKQNEQRSR